MFDCSVPDMSSIGNIKLRGTELDREQSK